MLYPIVLTKLEGVRVLVVGGGPVGERKVRHLLGTGARILLVSPSATAQLQAWQQAGLLEWRSRAYCSSDQTDVFLVFAATNQRQVNTQIADEAARTGRLCNVADAPHEGSFHLPAVHREAGLVVAVSSEANTPRRAVQLRDRIAAAGLVDL